MACTATAATVAGRNGHVESDDGVVRFNLSLPRELGGPGKPNATNPEQLLVAGYAAAKAEKVVVEKIAVAAAVTPHKEDGGFHPPVKLVAKLDGTDRATAQRLAVKAHQVCPYSKATRGNVAVDVAAA